MVYLQNESIKKPIESDLVSSLGPGLFLGPRVRILRFAQGAGMPAAWARNSGNP